MKHILILILLVIQSFLIQLISNNLVANAWFDKSWITTAEEKIIVKEKQTLTWSMWTWKVDLDISMNTIMLETNKTQNEYKNDIKKVNTEISEQKKLENKKIQDDWTNFRKENGWLYKYLRKNLTLEEKKKLQENLNYQKIIVKEYLQNKRSINDVKEETYKNNIYVQEKSMKDYMLYLDKKFWILIYQKNRIDKIKKDAEDSYLKVQFALLNQANYISEKAKWDIKNVILSIPEWERNDVIDILTSTIKNDEKYKNNTLYK